MITVTSRKQSLVPVDEELIHRGYEIAPGTWRGLCGAVKTNTYAKPGRRVTCYQCEFLFIVKNY